MKPNSIVSNLQRQFAKRGPAGARTLGCFTVTNSSRSADFRPLQRPEVKGLPTHSRIRQSSGVAVGLRAFPRVSRSALAFAAVLLPLLLLLALPARVAAVNLGPARREQPRGYSVVVSNVLESATSAPPALLTVKPAPNGSSGAVIVWGTGDLGQADVPSRALSAVTAISVGWGHSLALRQDGTVLAWGENWAGQVDIPASARVGVTALAAGAVHSLALKVDGSVVAWGGRNDSGEIDVPVAARSGVISIAAGTSHSLALKSDGSVVAWGYNRGGEFNVPDAARSGVTAIAAGIYHSLALKNDGSVVAWGSNDGGQCDIPVEARSGVTAIAAGYDHSMALKSDGAVVVWGARGWGILTNVPLAARGGVTAIAAGSAHALALKEDGTIIAWGDNSYGQTKGPSGLGRAFAIAAGGVNSTAIIQPTAPVITAAPLSRTVRIGQNAGFSVRATGYPLSYQWRKDGLDIPGVTRSVLNLGPALASHAGEYTVVVSNAQGSVTSAPPAILSLTAARSGMVVSWGSQTDSPTGTRSDITAVAAGLFQSLALTAGGAVVSLDEIPPEAQSSVAAIAAGSNHSVALKEDGSVIVWGESTFVPDSALSGVAAIASNYRTAALKMDGTVVVWDSGGELPVPGQASRDVTAISMASKYILFLKADGSVIRWAAEPLIGWIVSVVVPAGAVAIAAGPTHSLALTSDGSILAWGSNNFGEADVPAELQHSGVTGLAAGSGYSLALKADGSVVGWGNDEFRVAADGGISGNAVFAVAAGYSHALAIGIPGAPTFITPPPSQTVELGRMVRLEASCTGFPLHYQWRRNGTNLIGETYRTLSFLVSSFPEAGNFSVVVSNSMGSVTSAPPAVLTVKLPAGGAVAVLGFETAPPEAAQSGVFAIAAGAYNVAALKGDGSVVVWGSNDSGQNEVPPAALSEVTSIAVGGGHIVALKADGSMVVWGSNNSGQNDVPDAARSGVTAIAAGLQHTVALKSDGSVVSWGWNQYGQTDVPASARSGIIAIAAGQTHTLALKSDGTVIAWGKVYDGQSMRPASVPEGLSGVTSIAAGTFFSMALKSDGTVVTWGVMFLGSSHVPISSPEGLSGVAAIAAGEFQAVALKDDGTIVKWGSVLRSGEGWVLASVPPGLSGVTAVAAGDQFTALLFGEAPLRPTLQTTLGAGGLILSWPGNFQGFTLQTTDDLVPPPTWADSTITPTLLDGRFRIANPPSGDGQFFRLRK
jgi:alpha-tubulin suppressor-like RCC1 family protein